MLPCQDPPQAVSHCHHGPTNAPHPQLITTVSWFLAFLEALWFWFCAFALGQATYHTITFMKVLQLIQVYDTQLHCIIYYIWYANHLPSHKLVAMLELEHAWWFKLSPDTTASNLLFLASLRASSLKAWPKMVQHDRTPSLRAQHFQSMFSFRNND